MFNVLDKLDRIERRLDRYLPPVEPEAQAPARDWGAVPFTEFVKLLGGQPLSPVQVVICKLAFERKEPQDLEGEEFAIAQKLLKPPEQEEPVLTIPKAARSVLTLVKGGRIGGSYLSALYAVHRSLVADLSILAPGEVARVIFGAPKLDLAEQALSYAVGAFRSHPELEQLIEGEPKARRFVIQRKDGRKVEFVTRSADRGGASWRSRSLICACLTEVAFFYGADKVANDEDCFRACNPRVLPGGMTILESTPWAEAGLLFDQFTRNWGNPTTSVAMHAPTRFALPTERNLEVVANEEATDPDNAAREFGAQFIAMGSSIFFPRELLEKCRVAGTGNRQAPGPGEVAGIGGDFGLTRDAAAFAAVHRMAAPEALGEDERRDPKTDRFRLAECFERKPRRGAPLKLKELVPDACDLAGRHAQKSVLVDQWSYQPATESLKPGYQLERPQEDEEVMYDAVLERMKEGRVEIPQEFEPLLAQLTLVLSRPKPGGGKKIILPQKFGSHCDMVPAFVRALWQAMRADIGANVSQPKGLRPRTMSRGGGY